MLRKNNKITGSGASFFAMKHAISLRQCYYQSRVYGQTDRQTDRQISTEVIYESILAKFRQLFKIKDLKQYQKQCIVSILIRNDCFICKSTGSGNSFGLMFYKDSH